MVEFTKRRIRQADPYGLEHHHPDRFAWLRGALHNPGLHLASTLAYQNHDPTLFVHHHTDMLLRAFMPAQ